MGQVGWIRYEYITETDTLVVVLRETGIEEIDGLEKVMVHHDGAGRVAEIEFLDASETVRDIVDIILAANGRSR